MSAVPHELRDPQTNILVYFFPQGVRAQDSGNWVKVEGRDKFSIHLLFTGAAAAQICVSNEDNPADSEDGVQYGTTITATGASGFLAEIKIPVRWIKVKVSAYTSGVVSAILLGV